MRLYLESQGSVAIIGENVAYGAANETLMAIQNSGAQVTEQMQTIVLEEALDAFGKHFGLPSFSSRAPQGPRISPLAPILTHSSLKFVAPRLY